MPKVLETMSYGRVLDYSGVPMDNRPIDLVNFSVRTANVLSREGIKTIGQAAAFANDCLRMSQSPGFGHKSANELREALDGLRGRTNWAIFENAPRKLQQPRPPKEFGVSVYLTASQVAELARLDAPDFFREKLSRASDTIARLPPRT